MAELGVQLYSVREELIADYVGTVERLASAGYTGVELAGNYGASVESAVQLFQRLGLAVPSIHAPILDAAQRSEVIGIAVGLGAKYVVCAYIPPDEFSTLSSVESYCAQLNEANVEVQAAGLTLLYHNHWWEYEAHDYGIPLEVMLRLLDPSIGIELDIYWAKVGGADPVAALEALGSRLKLLHAKDGPATKDDPMLALGEGVMNYPTLLPHATAADWPIVELDRCATNMLEALEKSAAYMLSIMS
ncbi:MAG: sugar phosphate isomerase/epimerase [Anaerolineae bacterium]|nr:sugar phosphate isomerase/epimerase [Anaerolineae bacterium]